MPNENTAAAKDPLFNDDNQIPSNWITWGKPGNYIAGTLVAVRSMISNLPEKRGQKVNVYEIKADRGVFNKLDDRKNPVEPPVVITAGDFYNVGGKDVVDRQMRNLRLGTKVGLKFTEENPPRNRGFNPMKVIKVYVQRGPDNQPLMDDAWLAEQQSENADENFNKI